MVKLVFIYGLLFYLSSFATRQAAFGQEQEISGQLADKFTGATIDQVFIINTRSNQYMLSDKSGAFSILVYIGDTLRFSKAEYKPFVQVVTNMMPMHIGLESNTIILDEVNITTKGLTPRQTLTLRKTAYRSIYLKGDNKRIVQLSPAGLGITISINRLFSALSKEGKDARRLQHTFVRDYENNIVDGRFNKQLVQDITGLRGCSLDNFIMDNRPDYEWIQQVSDYELIQYIKERMLK